jgi:DNA-directed RNA polymerase subunit RPC12/RpoP
MATAPGQTSIGAEPGQLSPVAVGCHRCGHQWLSRARHGMPVNCPRCKHKNRVSRPDRTRHLHAIPDTTAQAAAALATPPPASAAEDDDQTYIYDADGRLVPATAAASPAAGITWQAALSRLGWRLDLHPGPGGCQIRDSRGTCPAEATRHITGGWVCGPHHTALASVIAGRSPQPVPPPPRESRPARPTR